MKFAGHFLRRLHIGIQNADRDAVKTQLFLRKFSRLSRRWGMLGLSLLFSFASHAVNEAPQTFTLDGTLSLSGTSSPLLDASAKLTVQIIDPLGRCLLYEEQQTVNTRDSAGRFTLNVGSAVGNAKRTVNDPGRTMAQIFQNTSGILGNDLPGQTCPGGVYTPAPGAVRYFRLTVIPSTTNVADRLTPDIVVDSVPNALVAQSLQGLERAQVLQTNVSGPIALSQANLEALFTTPAYTNLQAILAGNFLQTDTSGAALPSYTSNPAGASNGDIWFDSTTGEIKFKNAAGVQVVGASSGGGGISSLTVGSSMSINGTVAGTISSAGTIDLTNTGIAAGTYTKLTVDTKGRATAGTVSLVEGDIPNLTSAGKVSGNTITAGTISGSAAVNTSGNLITTGTVSGLNVQATNLRVYNGTNYVQFVAPTLSGIVNFTLPDNDGNPGDVLTSNGSGVLSWAQGTTTLAGDVSGPSGATSVDKIKGKSVAAGSASGQMMIYDGTSWVNNVMSGDATMAYTGILTLNKVPVSKGGTNTTSYGNSHVIVSNGTGSALQDMTCSLNQVISFDASGFVTCANVSTLSGAILNGGNTTGADISLGTNDNKALAFKVNNATAMTISQSGNVGFGTTSPTVGLHLFRDLSATSAGDGLLIETVTSNNLWYSPSIVGKNSKSNGSTSTGGVLINISGQSLAPGNGWGTAGGIAILSDGNPGFLSYPGRIELSTTPAGGTSPVARMTINNAGAVGIGISNPSAALEVGGQVKITGGTPGAGKVLTSDANGLATWVDPTANSSLIAITAVSYGAGGSTNSCGTYIQTACQGRAACTYTGSNGNCGGDPASGQAKKLIVTYACGSTVFTKITDENITTTMACNVLIVNGGNTFGATTAIGTTDNYGFNLMAKNNTAVAISTNGYVGIGTQTPRMALDISGTLALKAATVNATTTIDGSTGNMQYTNASCGSFQFNNLKDGGNYMFVVKGTTAATCTFTAFTDSGSNPLTVHMPPDNGPTTASKHTIFNLSVLGSDVYVAWTPGY